MNKPRCEVLFNTECLVLESNTNGGGWYESNDVYDSTPTPGLGRNQGWGFRADIWA